MSQTAAVKGSYWFSGSGINLADIDSSLFTHLFCAFANLDPQSNQVTVSPSDQPDFSTFTQTVQIRNPDIKTLLSIGGGNADKAAFASMASNPGSRQAFIESSISLARSYGFNGLDLDWEYPSDDGVMNDFGTLLGEWRSAVEAEASSSGNTPLLLTAAVYYTTRVYYPANYPVQAIMNSLDWVNLMAYDFYGPGWSQVTGPHAALYDLRPNPGPSGDAGVTAWIQGGAPPEKLVLGFPYYGHAWTLSDPNNNGYFAPTTGSNSYDQTAYAGIRQFIANNAAVTVYNPDVVGDYTYSGTTWIGYDDTQSIVTKVTYAKQNGLLGYFSWHVGADDNFTLSLLASQTWDG